MRLKTVNEELRKELLKILFLLEVYTGDELVFFFFFML